MSLTGLVFLMTFSAACLMSLARHPMFGLLAYVGVLYLDPSSRWWGSGFIGDTRWSLIAASTTLISIALHARTRPPRPFFSQPIVILTSLFVVWVSVQLFWVYDPDKQLILLEIYTKYLVATYIIYRSIETEDHLRWFLMAHILGCSYLGWIAFSSYTTGRFDDFGGAGLNEANVVANQVVTAILAAASIFLVGRNRERLTVFFAMPLLVNALVTTISRSGFLGFVVGGIAYNWLAPPRLRTSVRLLSLVGLVLFAIVSGPKYWERIGTIEARGQHIEGVDTGAGRLVLLEAQLHMFADHPLGCGHRCTALLAPSYMESQYLDPIEQGGTRSSHNTFMTLAVEQGLPGIVFYVGMLTWTVLVIRSTKRRLKHDVSFLSSAYPAVASGLVVVFIGDLFVDYLKHEVRFWLLACMLVMTKLLAMRDAAGSPEGTADKT